MGKIFSEIYFFVDRGQGTVYNMLEHLNECSNIKMIGVFYGKEKRFRSPRM